MGKGGFAELTHVDYPTCPACGEADFYVWQLVEQRQHYDAVMDEWSDFKHGEEVFDVLAVCRGCERDCRDVLAERISFYDENTLRLDPQYTKHQTTASSNLAGIEALALRKITKDLHGAFFADGSEWGSVDEIQRKLERIYQPLVDAGYLEES